MEKYVKGSIALQVNRLLSNRPAGATKTKPSPSFEPPVLADKNSRIAIRNTRWMPYMELLLHTACLSVSASVIALCIKQQYFFDFGEPSANTILNALQFIAKLYDMILGASLGAIILYTLQYRLCAGEGASVGYLSCAFQLSKTDQLFSSEFWSASRSRSPKGTTIAITWLGIAISVATVAAALFGPSSAILILPDLDWWQLPDPFSGHSGFVFYDASYESLWPTMINDSMIPNLGECLEKGPGAINLPPSCPFNMNSEISQWLVNNYNRGSPPNLTKSADLGVIRYLSASNEPTTDLDNNTVQGYSVASAPMTHLSRNLDSVWLYAQQSRLKMIDSSKPLITLSVPGNKRPLMKPLVQVQCGFPYDITTGDMVNVTFPSDQLVSHSDELLSNVSLSRLVNTTALRSSPTGNRITWFNLSAAISRPVFGALVGMEIFSPHQMFEVVESEPFQSLMPCTIETYWIPTTLSRDPTAGTTVMVDHADPMEIIQDPVLMSAARDLHLDLSYLEATNAPVLDREPALGVISWALDSVSYKPGHGFDGIRRAQWPWTVATVLSLHLTDALSRLSDVQHMFIWHRSNNTDEKSVVVDMMYLKSPSSYNHDVADRYGAELSNAITRQSDTFTVMEWSVTRFGYAWNIQRTTKYLAASVIVLHNVGVIIYLIATFHRRWYCVRWNNLSEILALALSSPAPPADLSDSKESGQPGSQSVYGCRIQILEDVCDQQRPVMTTTGRLATSKSYSIGWKKTHDRGSTGSVVDSRKLKPGFKYLI